MPPYFYIHAGCIRGMNLTASKHGTILVEKCKGEPIQQCFYVLDKKLKDLKIKANEDPDVFW